MTAMAAVHFHHFVIYINVAHKKRNELSFAERKFNFFIGEGKLKAPSSKRDVGENQGNI